MMHGQNHFKFCRVIVVIQINRLHELPLDYL